MWCESLSYLDQWLDLLVSLHAFSVIFSHKYREKQTFALTVILLIVFFFLKHFTALK